MEHLGPTIQSLSQKWHPQLTPRPLGHRLEVQFTDHNNLYIIIRGTVSRFVHLEKFSLKGAKSRYFELFFGSLKIVKNRKETLK